MADVLHIAQFYHTIRKPPQGPARLARRTGTVGQGDKMSFLLSIQGSCSRLRMEAVVESIISPVGNIALANADHGGAAHRSIGGLGRGDRS